MLPSALKVWAWFASLATRLDRPDIRHDLLREASKTHISPLEPRIASFAPGLLWEPLSVKDVRVEYRGNRQRFLKTCFWLQFWVIWQGLWSLHLPLAKWAVAIGTKIGSASRGVKGPLWRQLCTAVHWMQWPSGRKLFPFSITFVCLRGSWIPCT